MLYSFVYFFRRTVQLIVFILLFPAFAAGQVRINEVCTSNSSLIADPDYGKYSDWIELYNTGTTWVNIGGLSLSDDTLNPQRWIFPDETYIAPNGYKLIFADGRGTKLHTNFRLEKAGEFLGLYDSTGTVIDSMTIPYLLNDMSYGRLTAEPEKLSVFVGPTPEKVNTGTNVVRIASFVEFSLPGGFYSGQQKVGLSYPSPGQLIRYTTDGSYPTRLSKVYSDSIVINKTSVIRAICFEPGTLTGVAVTQTYFIDEPQNLPVFSIVTDSVHLFSNETGIMVQGTAGVPGYCTSVPHNLNQDWERPVNLEFYEEDGSMALNQMCGTKIFGGCSRIRYPQKSLAFFARSHYETSSFSHQLFPDKEAEEYETFILRASGDDQPRVLFRDALTQMMVKDVIDVDVQGYRPAVIYINGDYFGIINMREKLNEHYPENNYGVDSDNVDMLRRNPENRWNVISGSADHYNAMMSYIRSNDIKQKVHYDYVAKQMDVDEYINYQIIQIFFGGRDWPGNNIKFWRSSEEPYTRWRWMLYDLDGHSNDAVGNIMEESTEPDCGCDWPNPPWSTYLFRTMLENEEFAAKFVERFNTYTNTHFARDRYHMFINEMQNRIAPEIPRHIERWGGQKVDNPNNTWMSPIFNSVEEWNENVQVMREFVELRHEIAIQQVNDYFGIEGTKRLQLSMADSAGTTIMLGNTPLYDSTFSGNYSTGTKLTIGMVPGGGFEASHWEKVIYTAKDTMLINKGDEWKYYDSWGGLLDESWRTREYDDGTWSTGNAEFGYGDGDETTVVSFGPDPDNKYITTYFRKIIQIEDTASLEVYELQVKRDDGVVIFLNGHEIVKENMPQYGHWDQTLAVVAIGGDEENRYLIYNVNPALFVSGENILAVEIHQSNPGSSDLSFDLQLKGSVLEAGESVTVPGATVNIVMNENIGLTAYVVPKESLKDKVFINEIVAGNIEGITDEMGEYEDWIEFYNSGSVAVNMAGLILSDTLPLRKPWYFPSDKPGVTQIEPGGFLLVYADNQPEQGPLHANFRLNNDGEEVVLLQRVGNDTVVIDHVIFGAQFNYVSWGRYPDGSANFIYMPVTTPLDINFFEPEDTTSVEQYPDMHDLRVYPNPSDGNFFVIIESETTALVELSVYSITGSLIVTSRNEASRIISVSLGDQPSGLYILEVKMNGQRHVRKVVVGESAGLLHN